MENQTYNHIGAFPLALFAKSNTNVEFIRTGEEKELLEGLETIDHLKQINFFVGTNNSGKSRTIRGMFKGMGETPTQDKPFDAMKIVKYNKLLNLINEWKDVKHADGQELYKVLLSIHNLQTPPLIDIDKYMKNYTSFVQSVCTSIQEIIKLFKSNNAFLSILAPYELHQKEYKHKLNQLFENFKQLYLSDNYLTQSVKEIYNTIKNYIENNTVVKEAKIEAMEENIKKIENSVFSKKVIQELIQNKIFKVKNNIYIPILRGMRPLNNTDVLKDRTLKDYAINKEFIFTGFELYDELHNHLLGSREQRQLIKDFEDFLSKNFFNNNVVSLTPRINSDVVYVQIGQDEHPIYNLGDGIQAIIILTFPLFMRKNEPCKVFIEEPEMHLHPSLQTFFLDTLKEYFPLHQFFITTHSNVMLSYQGVDKQGETLTSVYKVSKKENEDAPIQIQHADSKKLSLLQELGYKPSDLLQTNYIIWVEGTSDIPYIRFFMEQLASDLKENVHFTIMIYGGSGAPQSFENVNNNDKFAFFKALSAANPNFAVIMDSDKKKEKGSIKYEKEKAHKKIRQLLGKKIFWITEKREIENYIPEELFKKSILNLSYAGKTGVTITLQDPDPDFGDRMKYYSSEHKLQAGEKVEFDKPFLEKYFDVSSGSGSIKINESAHPNELKDFIKAIEEKLQKACFFKTKNKTDIAPKVVETWRAEIKNFPLDDEIKREMGKIIDEIRNVSGLNSES